MPSQPDITKDESAVDWVSSYIRTTYNKPGNVYLGLLHRIDRPVGGALLLAKTSKAAIRLSEQFQTRKVKKTYLAITEHIPSPESGKLVHYIRKLPNKNIVKAYQKEVDNSKQAILQYKVIQTLQERALIEIQPLTGRKHQIRVQLADIGCVICGDVKYGNTPFLGDKSIALLAYSLEITHPTKKERLILTVDLPDSSIWPSFSLPS